MSQGNVEVVRELYRGWAQGDFSGINFFDPDIEFVSDFGVDRVTANGVDGMNRAWREQLRNWKAWRTGEIQELRDFSARNLNRPGIREALALLGNGDAGALVVAKLDRLSRSMLDFTALWLRLS